MTWASAAILDEIGKEVLTIDDEQAISASCKFVEGRLLWPDAMGSQSCNAVIFCCTAPMIRTQCSLASFQGQRHAMNPFQQQQMAKTMSILKVVVTLGMIVQWSFFLLVISDHWAGMTGRSQFRAVFFLVLYPLPALFLYIKRQEIVTMTLFMYILMSLAVRLKLS